MLPCSRQLPGADFTPSTFVDVLRWRADHQSDQLAHSFLVDGDVKEAGLTYRQLDRRARALARWLQLSGATGERVLLLFPPGRQYIEAFFGCLYAGATAVPAYPPRNNRSLLRIEAIVADAKATFALTTEHILSQVQRHFGHDEGLGALRWYATDVLPDTEGDWQEPALSTDALALLQYTSGSTGTPKGVMVSHGNLVHNSALIAHAFGVTAADRSVTWLPPFHDMGLIGGILQPIYSGFPCTLMSPVSFLQRPYQWLKAISDHQATISGGPDFAFELCTRKITAEERSLLDLSSWRVAFCGAEPIRSETLERFSATFEASGFQREAWYPCYGLAESTLIVSGGARSARPEVIHVRRAALAEGRAAATDRDDEGALPLVGCGQILPDEQIAIVNPATMTLCGQEQVGEIWVKSSSVALGYWNRPDATEQTFRAVLADTGDGPFLRTGDMGFQRDGELFVTGRLKDLIIIRGRNYYPQDLEWTAERSHPSLRIGCGAAFSLEVEGEERLAMVYEVERHLRSDFDRVIAAMRQAIAEELEVQAYAVVLVKQGSIPKTSSGKIQRHACQLKYLEGSLESVAVSVLGGQVAAEDAAVTRQPEHLRTSGTVPVGDEANPNAQIESQLREIVARKLRIAPLLIDPHQSLSSVGLDSLTSAEVCYEIEGSLGVVVPISALLQGPSVAELAALVRACQSDPVSEASIELIAGEAAGDESPLSRGQQALWFLNVLSPDSAAYHISQGVRICSPLDTTALRKAVETLAERHPALRTTFALRDGKPVQRVQLGLVPGFTETDAADRSVEALEQALSSAARSPFDLERGPLMRVALFQVSSGEHVLLLTIHHLISDFQSLLVLTQELGRLYAAERDGRVVALPHLPVKYGDYVQWQTEMLESAEGERLWRYWQQQLTGHLPLLTLHTDYPRPPVQSYRGAVETLQLSGRLTKALRELGRRSEATMFMTLFAAYVTLLQRHTGSDELVVGSPTSGRPRSALAGLIGYFANPVPLRVRLSDAQTFTTVLQHVRQTVLDAIAHQGYPFGLLVERLVPDRDASRSPVFQTMFVFHQGNLPDGQSLLPFALGLPGAQLEMGGLRLESLAVPTEIAQFDLMLTVAEIDDGLAASLQYSTDLFDRVTIRRMLEHFRCLLESIAQAPERPIGELPMLTGAEREQLEAWHATDRAYPLDRCLHEFVAEQAERTPDAIAVVYGDERVTYRELNRRSNQLAHHLRSLGVGLETLVGICVERSVDMVVGLLGILKAGGAYVPLDPAYPKERLAFILEDAGVSLLLSQGELVADLPEHEAVVVYMDTDWEAILRESDENPEIDVRPDNLAYVIYTSGSTGQPKGALITHYNVVRLFQATAADCQFNQDDVWTLFHSFAFNFSVWELWGALLHGGRLVVVPYWLSRSPEAFYDLLCAEHVTVLNQTPSAFRQLMRAEEERAAAGQLSLRLVIFGGEALEFQSLRPWFDRHGDRFPQLVNMYGITETTVHVTYRPLTAADADGGRGSVIGRPLADLQVYVLDQHLQPAPIGVAGEMYVGGAGLARGYLNRPQLTAERFIANPFRPGDRLYKTGDLARYLPDGQLAYLGRIDDQVKIRGFRIELGEIEAALCAHPAIREALVLVHAEGSHEKRLVAYVVPSAKQTPTVGALRAHLEAQLPDYMVPAAYVVLPAFPLTNNGKVDRRALPAPDWGRQLVQGEVVLPRTALEEVLAAVWAQVLRLDQIGIDDNFFALGGDSMRMIQVRVAAQARGVHLSVQEFYQYQTIRELALVAVATAAGSAAVVASTPFSLVSVADRERLPADVEDAYPLTMLQAGMLFHSEYSLESPVYHDIFSYHLRTRLEPATLQRAVDEVVACHPALRTAFDLTSFSESLQLVRLSVRVPLQVEDLGHLESQEQQRAIDRWIEAEKGRHFTRSEAPLWRLHIHRRGAGEFQLTLSFHHAILDGWSVAALITELFERYQALLDGEDSRPLPKVASTFRDFVQLEQEAGASAACQQYWNRKLDGLAIAELPRWRPGPEGDSETRRREVLLSQELSEGLRLVAGAAAVPLKSVLLAAHLRVMSFMGGQMDTVTGLVANGRPEVAGGDRVLGLFLNTLPFRLMLEDGSWLDLIRQVFEAEQELLPFRRYPLALMQQARGRRPLFETAFNYVHFHVYQGLLGGKNLEVSGGTFFEQTNFALMAQFEQDLFSPKIKLSLIYDGATLCDKQVEAMEAYYLTALESMAREPSGQYTRLDLHAAGEREQFAAWNATDRAYPLDRCLHELIAEQAERTPDVIAIVYEDERVTYRELNRRSNQLAHHLRSLGVGPETLVGICVERSVAMVVGLLGILKAGGAYVPLDPAYPEDRLAYMLADAAVPVLLTEQRLTGRLPAHAAHVICLDSDWARIAQESGENPVGGAGPETLAYVIYTSGSTGRPKGVMIPHKGIVNRLLWMQEEYRLTAEDRVLQKTPFSFDVSVWEFFWPLMTGAQLVVARAGGHQDPAYLVDLIIRAGITTLHFVPSMLQIFLEEPGVAGCWSLARVMCSGEALPYELQERFFSRLRAELHNLYGPTEASVDVTYWACERESRRQIVPIGHPIANTQMYVLDGHAKRVPVGVAGELHIGGVGVARGYLNRPELTEQKFIPDPFSRADGARLYKTGDLARYLPDGSIEYLGRNDHQVKIRGLRIELGEIESILSRHPGVREAVVLAREDDPGDKRVVAYVVPAQLLEKPTAAELREFLKAKLPGYMVPAAFIALDALPLTPNGKVDRGALPAPEWGRQGGSQPVSAPRTSAEHRIALIWQTVLKVEQVGLDDNFFELGGNSLLAIRVHAALKRELGMELRLPELFKYPTVRALAGLLAAPQQVVHAPLIRNEHRFESQQGIAIIGMACRFPMSPHLGAFWENLKAGNECISTASAAELEPTFYSADASLRHQLVPRGGFLDDIFGYDARFFNFTDKEALWMDPQHRLFFECVWEAIEDAGYNVAEIGEGTSLYAGCAHNEYLSPRSLGISSVTDYYQAMMSGNPTFLPTRVSYKLNLRRESIYVDTACSTSLVAVHMACQSLLQRQSDYALAGGVSISVPQKTGYIYDPGFILSADGRCRAFDAAADGTVPGNGAGVVLLKRLSDALRDGDPIHAVIRGSAINNDGMQKVGYMAPSVVGQQQVIMAALGAAGVSPESIGYVEAHGTGTRLGDPIEVMALTEAYRRYTDRRQFCALGSVKTNIGHTDRAAGIAGLIKTVLALKYRLIPPSLHFQEPNPEIDFTESPFFVNTVPRPWIINGTPARAGVSAFGIGGTNAHVVLEEAPDLN